MSITSSFSTRQSPSLLINGVPSRSPENHQEALAPPFLSVKGRAKLHPLSSITVTALPGAMTDEFSPFKLIVGSASSARRQIVADMGYEFTVMTADIDEKAIRMEKPEELVMAIAEAKADAVISKLHTLNRPKECETTVLISADTAPIISSQKLSTDDDYTKDFDPTFLITTDQVVVYDGVVREKPSSKEEAREFIKGYSGRHASTVSSVVVTNLKTGTRKGDWDRVEILFHEIPDKIIDELIEEGAVLSVAGGLIIEHPLVLPLVKQMIGTTDSVMGLPKDLTRKLIKEVL